MKFGPVPVADAEGAILAHALRLPGGKIAKGTTLTAVDIVRIRAAGLTEVIAAVIAAGDLVEDAAAARIGERSSGEGITLGPAATGRVNFFAETGGLFIPSRAVVDALNAVDPGITLATLAEHAVVAAGQMVATVKIIPLAVPGAAVSAAEALLDRQPAFHLAPFRARRIALIQTELPGTKPSVLDKTRDVLQRRLGPSASRIVSEARCAHRNAALTEAIGAVRDADMIVVFGASAVIDAADVIPAAVEAAGGEVLQLGMPVDPGNLLLLGTLGGLPVLGAPGCARSPKENGFDWVLNRLLADLPVTPADIRGMGVGGLLTEIATRPLPRQRVSRIAIAAVSPASPELASTDESAAATSRALDIVILAAGRSSRMGGPNKLLASFGGMPLIRRSALTALASGARRVRVVIGHDREHILAALDGLDLDVVENPDFVLGLSTSVIAACEAAFAAGTDGVLVMLADQPFLRPDHLDRLLSGFRPEGPGSIVVATDGGEWRNPVLLARSYRDDLRRLSGDRGARPVCEAHRPAVVGCEIGEAGSIDVDTPDAMAAAQARWIVDEPAA